MSTEPPDEGYDPRIYEPSDQFLDEPPAPEPEQPEQPEPEGADAQGDLVAPPAWPLIPAQPSRPPLHEGDAPTDLYGNPIPFKPFRTLSRQAQEGVVLQHGEQASDTLWRFRNGAAEYGGSEQGEGLSLTTDGTPDQRPWAVERVWVDGAMGFIAGNEKDTKSTQGYELVASLITGTPMWGLPEYPTIAPPARCIVIQSEMHDGRVQSDFKRILTARGYDPAQVTPRQLLLLSRAMSLRFDLLDGGTDWLLQKASEGYRYVYIDPLYKAIGEADLSDRSGNVPGIIRAMETITEAGLAVIASHPTSGSRTIGGLFGSKFFKLWMECGMFVNWHGSTSEASIRLHSVRDGYGETNIKLKGKGVGVWDYASERQREAAEADGGGPVKGTPEYKALKIEQLRASYEAEPGATDATHAERIGGISAKTVLRYRQELGLRHMRPEPEPKGETDA